MPPAGAPALQPVSPPRGAVDSPPPKPAVQTTALPAPAAGTSTPLPPTPQRPAGTSVGGGAPGSPKPTTAPPMRKPVVAPLPDSPISTPTITRVVQAATPQPTPEASTDRDGAASSQCGSILSHTGSNASAESALAIAVDAVPPHGAGQDAEGVEEAAMGDAVARPRRASRRPSVAPIIEAARSDSSDEERAADSCVDDSLPPRPMSGSVSSTSGRSSPRRPASALEIARLASIEARDLPAGAADNLRAVHVEAIFASENAFAVELRAALEAAKTAGTEAARQAHVRYIELLQQHWAAAQSLQAVVPPGGSHARRGSGASSVCSNAAPRPGAALAEPAARRTDSNASSTLAVASTRSVESQQPAQSQQVARMPKSPGSPPQYVDKVRTQAERAVRDAATAHPASPVPSARLQRQIGNEAATPVANPVPAAVDADDDAAAAAAPVPPSTPEEQVQAMYPHTVFDAWDDRDAFIAELELTKGRVLLTRMAADAGEGDPALAAMYTAYLAWLVDEWERNQAEQRAAAGTLRPGQPAPLNEDADGDSTLRLGQQASPTTEEHEFLHDDVIRDLLADGAGQPGPSRARFQEEKQGGADDNGGVRSAQAPPPALGAASDTHSESRVTFPPSDDQHSWTARSVDNVPPPLQSPFAGQPSALASPLGSPGTGTALLHAPARVPKTLSKDQLHQLFRAYAARDARGILRNSRGELLLARRMAMSLAADAPGLMDASQPLAPDVHMHSDAHVKSRSGTPLSPAEVAAVLDPQLQVVALATAGGGVMDVKVLTFETFLDVVFELAQARFRHVRSLEEARDEAATDPQSPAAGSRIARRKTQKAREKAGQRALRLLGLIDDRAGVGAADLARTAGIKLSAPAERALRKGGDLEIHLTAEGGHGSDADEADLIAAEENHLRSLGVPIDDSGSLVSHGDMTGTVISSGGASVLGGAAHGSSTLARRMARVAAQRQAAQQCGKNVGLPSAEEEAAAGGVQAARASVYAPLSKSARERALLPGTAAMANVNVSALRRSAPQAKEWQVAYRESVFAGTERATTTGASALQGRVEQTDRFGRIVRTERGAPRQFFVKAGGKGLEPAGTLRDLQAHAEAARHLGTILAAVDGTKPDEIALLRATRVLMDDPSALAAAAAMASGLQPGGTPRDVASAGLGSPGWQGSASLTISDLVNTAGRDGGGAATAAALATWLRQNGAEGGQSGVATAAGRGGYAISIRKPLLAGDATGTGGAAEDVVRLGRSSGARSVAGGTVTSTVIDADERGRGREPALRLMIPKDSAQRLAAAAAARGGQHEPGDDDNAAGRVAAGQIGTAVPLAAEWLAVSAAQPIAVDVFGSGMQAMQDAWEASGAALRAELAADDMDAPVPAAQATRRAMAKKDPRRPSLVALAADSEDEEESPVRRKSVRMAELPLDLGSPPSMEDVEKRGMAAKKADSVLNAISPMRRSQNVQSKGNARSVAKRAAAAFASPLVAAQHRTTLHTLLRASEQLQQDGTTAEGQLAAALGASGPSSVPLLPVTSSAMTEAPVLSLPVDICRLNLLLRRCFAPVWCALIGDDEASLLLLPAGSRAVHVVSQ